MGTSQLVVLINLFDACCAGITLLLIKDGQLVSPHILLQEKENLPITFRSTGNGVYYDYISEGEKVPQNKLPHAIGELVISNTRIQCIKLNSNFETLTIQEFHHTGEGGYSRTGIEFVLNGQGIAFIERTSQHPSYTSLTSSAVSPSASDEYSAVTLPPPFKDEV